MAEIEVDGVTDGPAGRFRHRATHRRIRSDLTPADIPRLPPLSHGAP